jgi:hypothetical protein
MFTVTHKGVAIHCYCDRPNCYLMHNNKAHHFNSQQAAKAYVTKHMQQRKTATRLTKAAQLYLDASQGY